MFTLKDNTLTRELAIRLLFDGPISYNEFIEHQEYKLLFEKDAKKEVIRGLTFRGFYSLWGFKGLNSFELIFEKLLENSIIEKYHNADKLFPNISEQSNILYKIQCGEPISKDEAGLLNFYLDDFKFSITNNKHFYKIYDKSIWRDAKLLTPYRKWTLETNDGILSKKERKELRKKVNLVQEEKEHQIVEYLLFITLTTNLDLFLVLNPTTNNYIITSKDQINEKFDGGFGLFICISKMIRSCIEYSSMQFLEEIKSKYNFENDENLQFVNDLLEIIKKSPSSKIQINANKGKVTELSFSNRDQNLDSYNNLKDYKRGEHGVTRNTSIEEYGTKKNAVISTGKIKYGKKKGK